MALPTAFLDELRARTPLAGLVGRRVKLARSGRQWKGCCPFHGEKSPSFYVYDDHYHCFGCGAHGDAVSFVMQSQGAGFVEAVEQLAGEAGLDVPKATPQAAEAERRRIDLYAVLEAAAAAFHRRLFLPEGARALEYLRGRGLTEDTVRHFGLGWSGEGRGALVADLARQEIAPELLVQAGLLTEPQPERPSRETFFNRVMFPIRDRRGRVVSFGGRTLGDAQPKYVNGPETQVFSKRHSLYGLDLARDASARRLPVIIVEGYLDVISLHQAGFTSAVAPLGTALTSDQLTEVWKVCPVPVLCFDADVAGKRAAIKALDVILPEINAERSMKFLFTYNGLDPDSLLKKTDGLIKNSGAEEFMRHLSQASSLREILFELLRVNGGDATPEQRASFRARLEGAAGCIRDKALAREYKRALLDQFFAQRQAGRRGSSAIRSSPIARTAPGPDAAAAERRQILLAILLRHPGLLHDTEEAFGALELPPGLDRLRAEILRWSEAAETLDSDSLVAHLTRAGLAAEAAQALSAVTYPLPACAHPDAQPAEAEAGWWHIFGLMHRGRLEEEVAAARRDFERRPDGAAQRRLIALCTARDALNRGEQGIDIDA